MIRNLASGIGIRRNTRSILATVGVALAAVALSATAAQIDISGPEGSVAFGTTVTVLPNGNIVVTDPGFSTSVPGVGAARLYDPSGVLISTLTGSSPDDRVGSGGVTVLGNGHYVVLSPAWDDEAAADVGAVTWMDGSTGLTGAVSQANSLVGTTPGDLSGTPGATSVVALRNGNYVVRSTAWDNGAVADVGAVTLVDGSTGATGPILPTNSLIGATAGDVAGYGGVIPLANGNYVVLSNDWDNGVVPNAGAVTWVDGSAGIAGEISSTNSLVGGTSDDFLGNNGITELVNGHYVVVSPSWSNGAIADVGAVTWADGGTGITGQVSASNSLIGTTAGDQVGIDRVAALSNGHYVTSTRFWDNGADADVGAATWADGNSGLSGAVSAGNSLIGGMPGHQVGNGGVTALVNGNYVVISFGWSDGTVGNVGAVTWADGSTGLTGIVSVGNSLVGSTIFDRIGYDGVTALSNGNYVVASSMWRSSNDFDATTGAVTWADGDSGISGPVSAANSLIGTTTSGVTALANGNYVVGSRFWRNGAFGTYGVGAVTWADGDTGITGTVSSANSLTGTSLGDYVGYGGPIRALANGNYVASSYFWDNDGNIDVGAVTLGDGSTGTTGVVSPGNSLVGNTASDRVGIYGSVAFADSNYAVRSVTWDNGSIVDAGAVTLARGDSVSRGPIDASNSVLGTVAGGGPELVFDYDVARAQLVVGQPRANVVSLFTLPPQDSLFADGFEDPGTGEQAVGTAHD